ncbi:MAG TPA: hypothetical protein VNV85_01305 [Puia sp.]|nr:hypothetical protein [Puia sp.]
MYWKKANGTDFKRAVEAYYNCCKMQGAVPIKPVEQFSEISDSHIILRNQFILIAKIFFVGTLQPYESKRAVSPSGSNVFKLQ